MIKLASITKPMCSCNCTFQGMVKYVFDTWAQNNGTSEMLVNHPYKMSECPFKVPGTAILTSTDLVQIGRGCVYWWENKICQVLTFSKKAFLSYVIFSLQKTPLTYYRGYFWHRAKFPKMAKFRKMYTMENIFFLYF